MVPAVEEKEPLTARLPAMASELAVVSEPETVRWLKLMPVPLMFLPAPLNVPVPAPPARCVKVPAPLVEKFPATFNATFAPAVIPAPAIIKSLKLLAPAPVVDATAPLIVTEPAVPVKAPLLVQLPPTECAKELPLKVVPAPMATLPLIVTGAEAEKDTEAPAALVTLARFPAMLIELVGNALIAAPLLLRVRLP